MSKTKFIKNKKNKNLKNQRNCQRQYLLKN
jgi:hypothetical protein